MAPDPARYRQVEARLWRSVGITPSEHTVTLPLGNQVRVQEHGSGDPLLFVHGATSSGANFAPLIARLEGFRCIAIDRPGCGLSDPLPNASDMTSVDDALRYADRMIVDVLDALALPKVCVVATSFGGLFTFRGVASNPDRFDKIIELSWPMGATMAKVPLSMRFASIPGMSAMMKRIPITPFGVRMILRQIGLKRALESGAASDELFEWFLSLLRDTDTMANELETAPDVITPIAGLNKRIVFDQALIDRVMAPVLFLWGDEDPMGGRTTAEPFVARFPQADLEMIHQAGHAPWIDEPDLIAARIGDFLAQPA